MRSLDHWNVARHICSSILIHHSDTTRPLSHRREITAYYQVISMRWWENEMTTLWPCQCDGVKQRRENFEGESGLYYLKSPSFNWRYYMLLARSLHSDESPLSSPSAIPLYTPPFPPPLMKLIVQTPSTRPLLHTPPSPPPPLKHSPHTPREDPRPMER